jgi:CHASE3 domain sensor protein
MFRALFPGRSYRLILLALIVPCILAVVPAVMAYYGEAQLRSASRWVSHTGEVQRSIQRVALAVLEAETAQRSFLLTGETAYRDGAMAAMGKVPQEITALRELTLDNPLQQENLEHLDARVSKRMALMNENIALRESGREEEVMARVKSGRGKVAMEEVRAKLDQMSAEENRLLTMRTSHLERMARLASGLTLTLAVVTTGFAVTIFVMLRRILRLESLVTICAWSRTVEYQGEWLSFEEYLLRRFNINTSHGIAPQEMDKLLESLPGEPPA